MTNVKTPRSAELPETAPLGDGPERNSGRSTAFLDEDSKMRQRYGVSPHSTELAFGTVSHKSENAETAPHVEWSHPDVGTLRFRGIVDRIDVSPSGKTALVIDYKTGGAGVYDAMKKDPVDRGRRPAITGLRPGRAAARGHGRESVRGLLVHLDEGRLCDAAGSAHGAGRAAAGVQQDGPDDNRRHRGRSVPRSSG